MSFIVFHANFICDPSSFYSRGSSAKGKADMKTNKVMYALIKKSKNEIIASNKEENEETRSVMRNAKDNLGSVMRNAEDNLGSKIDHIVQLLSAQKPQSHEDLMSLLVSMESYATLCTKGKRKRATEPRNKNAYYARDSQKKGRI